MRDPLRAVPAWAWLCGIVALSFAVRAWLARGMLGPFIMVDELIYSEMAKSFASDLRFAVRGLPVGGYGAVYPILIAPAYAAFDRVPDAYAAVKTINSLVMSLAAVPAYLIARRVVGKWLGAARRAARGGGAVDGLHGHGDDRERLLPGVPARRARARRPPPATHAAQPRRLLRGARARLPDAVAGRRRRRCRAHGAAPPRRVSAPAEGGAVAVSLALRRVRRWSTAARRRAGGARETPQRRFSAPTPRSARRATT